MTGDRFIFVLPWVPPVPMSSVTCPGCGHILDTIYKGRGLAPAYHFRDGRAATSNHPALCPVDADDLATLIARAQVAQAAEADLAARILEAVR